MKSWQSSVCKEGKMSQTNTNQKKRIALNYLYATLIGILVIACAVTIALVTSRNNSQVDIDPGQTVSGNSFVLPMQGATVMKDYSGSELQYNDSLEQWEIHKAVDFKPGDSLDVYAIADGTVSNVYINHLEGRVIEITHADGLVSIYKSLVEDVSVSVGDRVSAGQVIGQAGNTMSNELRSEVHLHLEMTLDGIKVDPNDYLSLGDK